MPTFVHQDSRLSMRVPDGGVTQEVVEVTRAFFFPFFLADLGWLTAQLACDSVPLMYLCGAKN